VGGFGLSLRKKKRSHDFDVVKKLCYEPKIFLQMKLENINVLCNLVQPLKLTIEKKLSLLKPTIHHHPILLCYMTNSNKTQYIYQRIISKKKKEKKVL
jgi:hypothetical protein